MQTKTVWCNSINQRRCDMLKVGFLTAKIWQPWYNDNKNMDCWSRFSFLDNKWFRSVQLLSRVQLFVIPWTTARQASLSITKSQRLLKLMSVELVMPSNHLILCHPLLLLPSIFPSLSVSDIHISNQRWWCVSMIYSLKALKYHQPDMIKSVAVNSFFLRNSMNDFEMSSIFQIIFTNSFSKEILPSFHLTDFISF